MPLIQGLNDRFQRLETTLEDNQNTFRASLQDTFTQIMDRLDSMEARPPVPTLTDLTNGNPLGMPLDVLSRWPWIEKTTVELIANGEFDLNNLPKLHREEELRNRHTKKVAEGLHFPADGGKPEFVTGRTKMRMAFKDLPTFLSAWLIYVSVRSSYASERGPGLAFWTERVVFHVQNGFAWSAVLNYAIAYFAKHQNSPPDAWYSVDPELVANHFVTARRVAPIEQAALSRSSRKRPNPSSSSQGPITEQTCQNWNRPNSGCNHKDRFGEPCPRKHRCAICLNLAHKAHEYPSKPST